MQLSPNLVNTHTILSCARITLFNLCLGSQVEIKQPLEEEEEKAASSKCIGPGCCNVSLPESVYCGHQCIVQHAATAMKSLSEPKLETKPAAPPPDPPLKVNIILVSFIVAPICGRNHNTDGYIVRRRKGNHLITIM